MSVRFVLRRPWLLMSAACLVPAILDMAQTYVQGKLAPEEAPGWRWMLWSGGEWIILGALIPITYFLGRRYPLRHPHVARNLVVHAAGALLLCIAWATIGIALGTLLGTTPATLASWMLRSLPWSVFMYFAVLGCVHAVTYFIEVREREAQAARLAAQVAEARLAALRTQIHPHFLFNSLNALLVLVRDHDVKNAERMLVLLSEVLRQVLRAESNQEVRLAEELRFLDDYLAVEQIRFSDRLRIVRAVDRELLDAMVPQFILQPLVENALRHGIGRSVEGGTIEIGGRREGDDVVLWVSDDGPGMSDAPNGGGVGLRNTRERIATLYGARATLELAPRPGGGTVARVRIPYRRATDPAATQAVT
jgi:two-component system LytT family sensor kinase